MKRFSRLLLLYFTMRSLTQREPDSMLAAMFSGRHSVSQDSNKGAIFIDRDGKYFRHILNWLRDGVIPTLRDAEYHGVLREAEYYSLLGLVEHINNTNKVKDDDDTAAELTRKDVVKCILSDKVRFRGVNLSGLNLSKLAACEGCGSPSDLYGCTCKHHAGKECERIKTDAMYVAHGSLS